MRRLLVPVLAVVVSALVVPLYYDSGERRSHDESEREGAFEKYIETVTLMGQLRSRSSAPFNDLAPGALAAAHAQKEKMRIEAGRWTPLGRTPMYSDDPTYAVSRLGHGTLSGRVTALVDDPAGQGRYFLAAAAGGVFETVDGGNSWRSIGDKLPTQVMGALGYSAASKVLIAGTGDRAFGGSSHSGLGIYRTTNNGRSWKKAKGVPDEILSFRIAFDPADASGKTVYAATSKGLFRSTDAGASFVNVNLPTSAACAGNTTSQECFFANIVTDVVVHAGGGKVMAAVGWRAGRALNKGDGRVQSPQNGIYVSDTGLPNSFRFVDAGETASTNGFAINPIVGRVALGAARGPGQNPDIVYAIVQDASKFAGCIDVLDINPVCEPTAGAVTQATVLDGAYVTTDFGQTWTKIMDWAQLREPGTNSSLGGVSAQPTYGPGIQGWYNLWIEPDPTATDPITRAPSRVLFGLEEVWQNQVRIGVVGPTQWEVIGRYWNACFGGLTVTSGLQCNGPDEPIEAGTTTHPDQHAVLFEPDGAGGVTVVIGNDGGIYKQHAAALGEFNNESWGKGNNVGLNTLQMYDLAIARDGTATAGLQDNGQLLIEPSGRAVGIYGGDGFDSGIDPDNPSRILEEYAGGRAAITTNGGRSWSIINPNLTAPLFWTPLVVDPLDANHFVVGGREIKERRNGYSTSSTWTTSFNLGTAPSGANRQTSALDVRGNIIYAGFCGYCDVITQNVPFTRGIATNVSGAWRFPAAAGLPVRYITSIQMDPNDPLTVYVTLGGYGRRWVPPGMVGEDTSLVGEGHVFKSVDGGETFVDISGDLPDVPANWLVQRQGRLIVATDIGVFISTDTSGGSYSVLGEGLPHAPVFKLRLQPGNEDHLIAVTYGRGAYSHYFTAPPTSTAGTPQPSITGSVVTNAPLPLVSDANLNRTGDLIAARWEFEVLPGFDNSRMIVNASYSLPADVDLFLQIQQPDGRYVDVSSGTSSRLDGEMIQVGAPAPGRYLLLVENWAGLPQMTVDLKVTFYNAADVPGQ